jgi:hypothetical protein
MQALSREELIKRIGDLALPLPAEKTKIRKIKEYDRETKSFKDRELTYIPIYVTVEELNDKFGPHWRVENLSDELREVKYTYTEDVLDDKGNLIWKKIKGKSLPEKRKVEATESAVFCSLDLVIRDDEGKELCRRPGTGSGTNSGQRTLDSDKMTKTALANAIRKASNNYGLGLYLWHADDESMPRAEEEIGQGSAPEKEAVFSKENLEKIDNLCTEHGLGKDNLSDYLKKCFSKSEGKPSFLKVGDTDGTQDEKITKFVAYVTEDLGKKDK